MNKQNNINQFSFQFVFIMIINLIIVILSVMIISLGKTYMTISTMTETQIMI